MTADQVLGAFEQDRIEPVTLPILYRVAMFLVAIGLKSYQPDISLTGSATSFRKATDVGVDENALRRLTRFVVEVCSLAQDLRDVFGERGYPFAAKGRTMLLRDAIVVDVPTVRDLAESCATAKEVLTRYHNTFWRVTAGLMGIAIRVEEEMGIIQGQGDPLN